MFAMLLEIICWRKFLLASALSTSGFDFEVWIPANIFLPFLSKFYEIISKRRSKFRVNF